VGNPPATAAIGSGTGVTVVMGWGNTRGMCREPFQDGQLTHIDHDHDHDCCDTDCRSCGECVRRVPVPCLQHHTRPHPAPV
jgi:hypothetical protein